MIKIDQWSYGTHVEYMLLEIYRGSRFFEKGMFDIVYIKSMKINACICWQKAEMKHIPFPITFQRFTGQRLQEVEVKEDIILIDLNILME